MVKRSVGSLKPEELAGKVVFVRSDLNVPQVCLPPLPPPPPPARRRPACLPPLDPPIFARMCIAAATGQGDPGHHR